MTTNNHNANSNGKPITATKKQQLPQTQFFYTLAMKRSAEIKSQGESNTGADKKPGDRTEK